MIARMWHETVPQEKARAYRDFLLERAIPDCRSAPGHLSVQILQRSEADLVHFVTLPVSATVDAVRAFTGADDTLAKYFPEDRDFLIDREPRMLRFEVVGEAR